MPLFPGVNIYSGTHGIGGALTNPTELAFRKGSIQNHYPVVFRGAKYEDAEAAYQQTKARSSMMSFDELQDLLVDIDAAKLQQHPRLITEIKKRGGVAWLETCWHRTYARTEAFRRWEGQGRESATIRVLIRAYEIVTQISAQNI